VTDITAPVDRLVTLQKMSQITELDNRGLDPPEPLLRIMDAVATMDTDGRIVALMDREPLLLYPMLEDRGLGWTIEEHAEGWYRLEIGRGL
jgi:hypothetical protein